MIRSAIFALAATTLSFAAADAQTPAAAASPPAFAQCKTCHSVKPGENRVGPTLWGVVGRKSGSVPGYNYSAANKKHVAPWTVAELDKYLTNPQAVVPGTKMAYPGQKDPVKRKQIIAYLQTLK